jgi:hypothetical protein
MKYALVLFRLDLIEIEVRLPSRSQLLTSWHLPLLWLSSVICLFLKFRILVAKMKWVPVALGVIGSLFETSRILVFITPVAAAIHPGHLS